MALSQGSVPVDNRCDSDSTHLRGCAKNTGVAKTGVPMLRLTILLCFGMLVALFTLGEDRGQLRPGLAKAEAEGRLDEVWAKARAEAAPTPKPVAEAVAVATEVTPVPAPKTTVAATAPVTLASTGPVVEVEAGRDTVQAVEEPVFTLSALGNESVPGEDGTPIEAAVAEASTEAETLPDAAPAGGTIWYVTADSVNVRSAPSTEAEVLGRLGSGEATLLVAAVDSDWARIVIQGDGVEGYVALRYLSPNSP
jgi:Bacterial SH3 domain